MALNKSQACGKFLMSALQNRKPTPERSGVGFLFCNADIKNFPQAWDLFKAMGKAQAKLYTSAGAMMERVTSGEHLIAYGVFGSYALGRSKKDPNLGIILPKDYTM